MRTSLLLLALAATTALSWTAPELHERGSHALSDPILAVADDARIHLGVRAALIDRIGLDGLDVDIDVSEGMVDLSGILPCSSEGLAFTILDEVEGVRAVRSRLDTVDPAARKVALVAQELDDTIMKAKVRRALLDSLGEPGLSVDVQVESALVRLQGTLPHRHAVEAAVAAVEEVEDVGVLHHDLRIGR